MLCVDTHGVALALSRGSVNFASLTLLPTTAWDLIFIPSSFLHSKAVLEPPSRHPGAEGVVLPYGKSWHPSELTERSTDRVSGHFMLLQSVTREVGSGLPLLLVTQPLMWPEIPR